MAVAGSTRANSWIESDFICSAPAVLYSAAVAARSGVERMRGAGRAA